MTMKINFTRIDNSHIGYVEVHGDKLTGSNSVMDAIIKEWYDYGQSTEDFIAKYSGWDGSFVSARLEPDEPDSK